MNNETDIIKQELRYAIINKRAELDIPQTKMAELLGISPRSYVDIGARYQHTAHANFN